MLFIGICGASGSGKSTLAKELVRDIGARAVVLNQDAYYRDHPDLSFEERTGLNYDEPCIFDHDLLYQDVTDLLAGKSVTRKAYDFSLHRRNDTQEIIQPADVLIVEGIHAFYDQRLLEKCLSSCISTWSRISACCAALSGILRIAAARSIRFPPSIWPR